ncbi:MAG: carbohydrate kinase family protein [Candidatus Heimdallarchaeota archaeon]|nr:carbohydrate kinase family protein [Candidatus Heimdallarchaeota archaeon]MBY8996020.1 carbohydrate kinase family protein [Candidatus Heimdallarchaeota archaeon]
MPETFDVISVGAVLVDMIALVEEFPKRDGESFVRDFKFMPGGAAANVAVTTSRLGLKTAFSGKIGKDTFGELLLNDLIKEKVHVKETVVISQDISTGSCYICVDKKGDRMIMAYSGAADTLAIDDLPLELFSKANWVNLSDLRNISSIEALLESDNEINFSMSPGALIAQNPSRAFRLAQKAKLIVASVDEITKIFRCSEDEINSIAADLIKENKERVIAVTKGSRGATIYSNDGTTNIPIFKVDVVDTTGAGDAFTAGMLYALTRGKSPKEAGRYAAACSAICIQELGARSGPKSKKDLIKFIRKN